MTTSSKIRSLAEEVAWRRQAPAPVVFTNGVFDLLHPGHVAVREGARAEGASLIVAVNDDPSAARLGKGPGRPVTDARTRARMVAALEAVDCVVLFAEDTPEAVIAALEPDVLVKGGDYCPATLPGRARVEARGGRVITLPLEPGYSSTAIIRSIRGTS